MVTFMDITTGYRYPQETHSLAEGGSSLLQQGSKLL